MNQERLLATFLDLIQLDSETGHEREVADYAKAKLTACGFEVTEDGAGAAIKGNSGNVIAFKPGTVPGHTIMLCAHMDTVTPGIGVEPVIRDGIISSKGQTILGGDDKAGIAAILEAVTSLTEAGAAHGPVQVVLTIAEEGGLNGSKNLDLSLLHQPIEAAFCFDSSNLPGQIVVEAPIQLSMSMAFRGKAAHAGLAPEEGISAIQMAAEAITQMTLGRIDHETTANIGVIAGGKATNIVTDHVVLEGECRSLDRAKVSAQKDHMVDCCEAAAQKFGGQVTCTITENYAGILLDHGSLTVKIASRAVSSLGMTPDLCKTGGGSDANIFNGYHIDTTNMGVGMAKVHSTEEFIKISNLEATASMVVEIIKAACDETL